MIHDSYSSLGRNCHDIQRRTPSPGGNLKITQKFGAMDQTMEKIFQKEKL